MKINIILVLLVICTIFASATLSTQQFNQLDPHEVNEMINVLTQKLATTENSLEQHEYLEKINLLLQLSNKHINHTSWYYKVKSIVSFTNIIAVLICVVLIVFIVSLFYDIIITFGLLTIELVIIFLGGNLKFYLSYTILGYLMFYNPANMCFLGETTMIFYLLCFYCMSSWQISKVFIQKKKNISLNKITYDDIYDTYIFGLVVLTTCATLLHDNYLSGIGATMLLLYWNGCVTNKIYGGFEIGFNNMRSLKSTTVLTTILTSIFVAIKLNMLVMSEMIKSKVMLFETGILFWCPLFGFIAMLILCNHDFTRKLKIVENIITFAVLIIHLYFGFTIDSNSLINLSCLFLWLWGFTFEWTYFAKVGIRRVWIMCAIILINLYALYYVGNNYPQYLMLN